ncbi:MAG: hypothetical protein GC162_20065 [Planctomycetes bacterium]|nr:hypothetical protein [Planctomycetota bacterium]
MHPLIEAFSLYLPGLPPALEGFRILQITDLHARRARGRHDQIIAALDETETDLLVLTGDLMDKPGSESVAYELTCRMVAAAKTTLGVVGVWGNHDSKLLRQRVSHLPVTWLTNEAWVAARLPLTVLGVECAYGERTSPRGDLLATLLNEPAHAAGCFRLLLSHLPTWLPAAGAAGIPLMLSGHTHGGQVRPPSGIPFYNATPGWPLAYSTGILQSADTFCIVSRGLGESAFDGLRLFCRPHAPLITLHRADAAVASATGVTCVQRW